MRREAQQGDQRLREGIASALDSTGYPLLRQLGLHYESGTVTLFGRVPSYFLKQLAQVTVMSVPGVRAIDNQLQVVES